MGGSRRLSRHRRRDCFTLWVANAARAGWSDERVECAAADTAALTAGRTSPTVVVSNEIGMGGVPATPLGRSFRDLLGRVKTPAAVRFPGGESLADLMDRVLPAVAVIRARHEGVTAALVAHDGPIRVVLAEALGLGDEARFRLGQANGALSAVDWTAGVPTVQVVNAVLYSPA